MNTAARPYPLCPEGSTETYPAPKEKIKYGVEIMLGSDAHREEDVGDFTRTEKILKEVDFPEELIVNRSLSYVKNWLRV